VLKEEEEQAKVLVGGVEVFRVENSTYFFIFQNYKIIFYS